MRNFPAAKSWLKIFKKYCRPSKTLFTAFIRPWGCQCANLFENLCTWSSIWGRREPLPTPNMPEINFPMNPGICHVDIKCISIRNVVYMTYVVLQHPEVSHISYVYSYPLAMGSSRQASGLPLCLLQAGRTEDHKRELATEGSFWHLAQCPEETRPQRDEVTCLGPKEWISKEQESTQVSKW